MNFTAIVKSLSTTKDFIFYDSDVSMILTYRFCDTRKEKVKEDWLFKDKLA